MDSSNVGISNIWKLIIYTCAKQVSNI